MSCSQAASTTAPLQRSSRKSLTLLAWLATLAECGRRVPTSRSSRVAVCCGVAGMRTGYGDLSIAPMMTRRGVRLSLRRVGDVRVLRSSNTDRSVCRSRGFRARVTCGRTHGRTKGCDWLIDEQCGARDAGHRHQVRLSLAESAVRFVDRDLVLGDDRVQFGPSQLFVDHGCVHKGDCVGLAPLCVPQPGTGTLVK